MDKKELQQAIVAAMKARDKDTTSVLRQVMQAVRNIEIDEQREATEVDVTAATKKLIKVTREEAEALEKSPAGHEARIAMLRGQLSTLEGTLPEQVKGDALADIVREAIAEVGATTRRDTGKVIASVVAKTDGNVDKAEVAKLTGALLS